MVFLFVVGGDVFVVGGVGGTAVAVCLFVCFFVCLVVGCLVVWFFFVC